MLASLLESFLLGFAISAVPGAVFFETVRRIMHDDTSVVSFLVGNFGGMIVIILAAFFGLSAIPPDSPVAAIFYIASGALLVYIGLSSVIVRKNTLVKSRHQHIQTKYSALATGFVLAVANPLSIAFWISLSGKFLKDNVYFGIAILDTASVVLGALLLFILLVSLVRFAKLKIKTNHLLLLSRVFGLLIVGYGLLTLAKVFELIWQ